VRLLGVARLMLILDVTVVAVALPNISTDPGPGRQLLRAFIDQAVAGRPIAALALVAGAYVAVALSGQALAVTAAYGATQLAWTVTNDLRGLLLRHTLELDLSFHGTHPPGELIERTDGDVTALSTFVSSLVMHIVGSALTLTAVLVVVLLEDWRVGLALAAFALATVGRADEIPVLEQGRIAEHGERLALAADPRSRFARLLATNQAVAAMKAHTAAHTPTWWLGALPARPVHHHRGPAGGRQCAAAGGRPDPATGLRGAQRRRAGGSGRLRAHRRPGGGRGGADGGRVGRVVWTACWEQMSGLLRLNLRR
jgi:hypothetical protein